MMLLLFFQVVIGLVIGFYLTDKKRGISYKEIQFGAIVMMATVSVLFFTGKPINVHNTMITALSGLILFGGIFAGEFTHVSLIKAVLQKVEKENIHVSIKQFVELAKGIACSPDNAGKDVLDAELYKTVTYLKSLAVQARRFKQTKLAEQIEEVANTCVTLSKLSLQIKDEHDDAYKKYESLANQLLDISWDALSHTEQNIKADLGKSINLIAFAVKAVHSK